VVEPNRDDVRHNRVVVVAGWGVLLGMNASEGASKAASSNFVVAFLGIIIVAFFSILKGHVIISRSNNARNNPPWWVMKFEIRQLPPESRSRLAELVGRKKDKFRTESLVGTEPKSVLAKLTTLDNLIMYSFI